VRKIAGFLIIALAIAMISGAQADVVVKMKSSVNTMGLMNADIQSTEYVNPDMSAMENTVDIKGGMMAMLGDVPQQKTIEIDRLDKGIRWSVDLNDTSYTEQQLATLKENMPEEEQGEEEIFGEAENYDWTVQVTTVDEPVDINGFKCKGITAIAKGVSKEDPKQKTDINLEYWYAKDIDGYDELMAYQKKYSEATGMDMVESQKEFGQMFGEFGDEFGDLLTKIDNAEGYPIKTVLVVKGSAQDMGDVRDEETQKGAQPGMMEMFKGMMGQAAQPETEDGMATLFSVTNVVESIKKETVEKSIYEVPEGFEQK
jgi:hypothetical protein